MKAKIIGLMIIFGLIIGGATAQQTETQKTESFELNGEQGKCTPLDKVLKDVKGVISTDYEADENLLYITYDTTELNRQEIENELLEDGYVAENVDRAEHEKMKRDAEKEEQFWEDEEIRETDEDERLWEEEETGMMEEDEITIIRCSFPEDEEEMKHEKKEKKDKSMDEKMNEPQPEDVPQDEEFDRPY